jgi:hypothetical protein
MEVLQYLRNFVSESSRVIKFGAGLQNPTRKELVDQLQAICSRCESAYSSILAKLRPVKDSYNDREHLARALRDFANDPQTRDSFKPDQLCGEADHLLDRLTNNLDLLKYAIDVRKIKALKEGMAQFQNYDGAIYSAFDEFALSLDHLANDLSDQQLQGAAAVERMSYVRHVVEDFEDEISQTVRAVQDAKNRLLR